MFEQLAARLVSRRMRRAARHRSNGQLVVGSGLGSAHAPAGPGRPHGCSGRDRSRGSLTAVCLDEDDRGRPRKDLPQAGNSVPHHALGPHRRVRRQV